MSVYQKKILVPLDGSERCLKTIQYITEIKPLLNFRMVLFHVLSAVPESFYDLERDPRSTGSVHVARAWERQQKKFIQAYMQKARQTLLNIGFSEDAVSVKIQKRSKGIARDIIREAREDYAAVLARRRGMTGLRGIVLGSVAVKLLEKLSFLPFIMAGRAAPGNKILLAFDGSEGAMRAVNFVGSTLGGYDFHLGLISVLRGSDKARSKYKQIFSPKEYTDRAKSDLTTAFDKAKTMLIESGFKADRVSTKIVTGAISRAKVIAAEAKQEGYGTIVLGRRGVSGPRDFFIGRVTNKVIHIARERTVWVVR
jgi:nucleotide-binding universal stress UspA family protein